MIIEMCLYGILIGACAGVAARDYGTVPLHAGMVGGGVGAIGALVILLARGLA